MSPHPFSRLAAIGAAICIVALTLGLVFNPVQAATADNNVEWNGAGHIPGNNICGDINFPYRSPLAPSSAQTVTVLARSYYQDLTGLTLYYTTNSAAALGSDWSTVSATWTANWFDCGGDPNADMDIWTATIPVKNQQVWYKFAYTDGTDTDWLLSSSEGTLSDGDGGWTTGSTTLTYIPTAAPDIIYVDDGFNAATPGWGVDHFATVQGGVDAVAIGGSVNIAAGTYVEQVLIQNKPGLSLLGAGQEVVTIQSPTILSPLLTGIKPIIGVTGGGNLTISDLTIDGDLQGASNYHFYGIYYRNTGGIIQDVTIVDVTPAVLDGLQHGIGINIENSDKAARNITISGCTISNYEKSAININQPGLTGLVTGNTLTGMGSTDVIEQFGIQFAFGSTGSAIGNDISGNDDTRSNYHPAYYVGAGIVIYGSDNVVVQNNELHDNEAGIYVLEDTSFGYKGTDNTQIISNNLIDNAYGIFYHHRTDGSTPIGNTGSVVAFNRILGNTTSGVRNEMIAGVSVLAENNWWGCNAGPGGTGCDTIYGETDADPWLVLNLTSTPATVLPLGDSVVAAGLVQNSDDQIPTGGTVPDGIQVNFTVPDGGSVSPTSAPTLDGEADTTFTAPIADQAYAVCATVDNQSAICSDVTVANVAPVAINNTYTVSEDATLTITAPGVLNNDTDANGDTLAAVLNNGPTNGILTLNSTGAFTYSPTSNFYGSDTFSYKANDGLLDSNIATVTITVTNVNDPPVAEDDTVSTTEDTPLLIAESVLLANDVNVDPDTLSVTEVSNPTNGAVMLVAGTITFTPTADFHGTAGFDYIVSDSTLTDTGHVAVTVNLVDDAPVAVDDTASTNEDTLVDILVSTLLSNDLDADGDTLSLVEISNATGGTLSLVGETITFTPALNFNGEAGFDYTITDGTTPDTGHVTITVVPVNDAPVAVGDTTSTDEDTPALILDSTLLANDTDVDLDTLTVTGVNNATNGTVALAAGTITFTPALNFQGTAGFDYIISDGTATDTGHVTVTVVAVNDPPVAVDDAASTDEDTPVDIFVGTLLANDIDFDGDTLTVTGVSNATNGTVTLAASIITFTPTADFNGEAGFDYTITDGTETDTGHVTITVDAVNDAPVAVDDAASTDEDTDAIIQSSTLLSNDTDADDDTLTLTAVSNPTNGTVGLDAGTITFTPTADFNGTAGFDYTISDGTLTDTGHVTVTVISVNDAPVAVDDAYEMDEDTVLTINAPGVLNNDTDADGDTLTAVLVAGPTNGTLTLNADGSFTYTPAPNFFGTDTFTYVANDGTSDSNIATVTLTVADMPEPKYIYLPVILK